MSQCVYDELDSSRILSCIEQALKSENVSHLAKFLAEYESESRSAEANSPDHRTEMMTSSLSRDACKLFLFSGSSVEAEVHRQLVVERINDGNITTTLKLCFISRDQINSNLPISGAQTLSDTFDKKFIFLSFCDEWYQVLEPRGLMNIEQRELLREWISTRQYANIEDPIVSLVIEKCSEPKKEEERKLQEAKKMREEKENLRKLRKRTK